MVRRVLAANAPALVFTGFLAFTGYAIYFAHNQQFTEKQVRLLCDYIHARQPASTIAA